ncbi:hypothetical protein [Sediminibacterium ginsengisoli]|uniref:SMODS and SLOG-associating 2TM effector domain-containing protein n=1 Tax=Sediminibacterium ginsengisoli TaxID=413434 RepID=A0A1T4JPT9_9BACT|nr:hypothetical protein [Sediminibacterium ginsengisoli]SJZ32047.1 hypothetical protein SAMN04488132_10130 [Sediminibacterium ginsengisoli]
MDDDFAKEHGLLTEKELSDMDKRWEKQEEEGLKNTLKHFDRIHDKLFTFNNILIAGYFALSKLEKEISLSTILIPIANLMLLLFVEYRMMEKSRFESDIRKKPFADIAKWGKSIGKTNMYSLLCILSTGIVTIIFLAYLL